MLILPLIDLLILMGTASLGVGFVIKAITITTRYTPTVLGFTALDCVVVAAIFFAFAVALVGRTWMKLNEPRLASLRRETLAAEARFRAAELEFAASGTDVGELAELPVRNAASADHH